ncbi:hypothetical protein DFH06DRAFT_1442109 [Mycena polygramma]|nr:hypothetical protein DFH06DRAFT_1442109 [Mycena polygramma]
MSTYKSFAVIGAGTLGLPLIEALVAKNVSVVLLSRPGSSAKTVPSGVHVVHVDYTDAVAVAAVFKQHKVEVVLATVTATAGAAQTSLADAAKLAQVKLSVPSEYGFPSDGCTAGIHGEKNEIAVYLKSLDIPTARIYNGMFIEFIPWLTGYHGEGGKFAIVGKGEAPVSFTAISDVAGFVAHILTTLPASQLENRVFRLEGERASLNAVAGQFKAAIEYVDSVAGEFGELKTGIAVELDTGAGSTGWDRVAKVEGLGSDAAGSANALWKGHHWKTIKEVHNL